VFLNCGSERRDRYATKNNGYERLRERERALDCVLHTGKNAAIGNGLY